MIIFSVTCNVIAILILIRSIFEERNRVLSLQQEIRRLSNMIAEYQKQGYEVLLHDGRYYKAYELKGKE